MKILIFTAYFYPHNGGMENYVQKLFSELRLESEDVDVTIVTSNSENVARHEKRFGMDIYRFKCWNLLGGTYPVIKPSEYKNIEKLFQSTSGKSGEKFDYIITQTRFFNTSLIGCRFAKKFKIPLIHFEHGTNHSPVKNPIFNILSKVYDHTIGKYIIRNSYKLVGISHASEKFVKHIYADASTECIYNSVDVRAFADVPIKVQKALKKRLGVQDKKIIVYVGRVIYAKGIQDLLEACKDLEDTVVLIIGDGNYLPVLKQKYPWAKYVGEKTLDEIKKYLSIADLFVNPSYAEGLPTSILEAGATGVPVIATDVGGTCEIIRDGVNGFLVKPKEIALLRKKVVEILSNKKLRSKFSVGIRRRVHEDFDWSISRKRVLKLLN